MAKTNVEPAEEPELQEVESEQTQDNNEDSESGKILDDEVSQRRNQRKSEWGTQCDRWLIRHQQKGQEIKLYIGEFDPNINENAITAIPKRIDQHFVQFEIDGREVWVGKRFIAGLE